MKFYQSKKSSGFTLIELLVVISIISVLATTVLAATSRTRFKAKVGAMKKEFQQLSVAAQLYYDNNGNRWGGDLQTTPGICPTTGSTMFASPDVKSILTAIAGIFPGSTLECMATQDTLPPFNTPPAKYWTVYLTVPAQSGGGTNRWCMDTYTGVGGTAIQAPNGVLNTHNGSYNRVACATLSACTTGTPTGQPYLSFCGELNSPGTDYTSPDW